LLSWLRAWLYQHSVFRKHRLSVPVISVGNMTAGGTGKTPFTLSLARWAQQQGFQVGILTRGYKRRQKDPVVINTRKKQSLAAAQVGDEPSLLAGKLDQGIIVVQRDRVSAGQTAIREYGCNLLIMDDGFQYQRLVRDLDLVLWDGYQQPRKSALLPCGKRREPWQALQRATALIVTRTAGISRQIDSFFGRRFPDLRQFNSPLIITAVVHQQQQKTLSPKILHSKRILAFCGLGNPEQFFKTVRQLKPKALLTRTFPDHHRYSAKEIHDLETVAADNGCDYLLTTEKDWINLPATPVMQNLVVLTIRLQIDEHLQQFILDKLSGRESGIRLRSEEQDDRAEG